MVNELKKAVWTVAVVAGLCSLTSWPASGEESGAPRKVIRRVTPMYSDIAKKAHLIGVVKLSVNVSEDGTVKTVRTLGGNAVLASSAEQAARQWKYEPLKRETVEAIVFNFNGE